MDPTLSLMKDSTFIWRIHIIWLDGDNSKTHFTGGRVEAIDTSFNATKTLQAVTTICKVCHGQVASWRCWGRMTWWLSKPSGTITWDQAIIFGQHQATAFSVLSRRISASFFDKWLCSVWKRSILGTRYRFVCRTGHFGGDIYFDWQHAADFNHTQSGRIHLAAVTGWTLKKSETISKLYWKTIGLTSLYV